MPSVCPQHSGSHAPQSFRVSLRHTPERTVTVTSRTPTGAPIVTGFNFSQHAEMHPPEKALGDPVSPSTKTHTPPLPLRQPTSPTPYHPQTPPNGPRQALRMHSIHPRHKESHLLDISRPSWSTPSPQTENTRRHSHSQPWTPPELHLHGHTPHRGAAGYPHKHRGTQRQSFIPFPQRSQKPPTLR